MLVFVGTGYEIEGALVMVLLREAERLADEMVGDVSVVVGTGAACMLGELDGDDPAGLAVLVDDAEMPAGDVVVDEELPTRNLLVVDELGLGIGAFGEGEPIASDVPLEDGLVLLKMLLVVADGLPLAPFAVVDEGETPAAAILEGEAPIRRVLLVLLHEAPFIKVLLLEDEATVIRVLLLDDEALNTKVLLVMLEENVFAVDELDVWPPAPTEELVDDDCRVELPGTLVFKVLDCEPTIEDDPPALELLDSVKDPPPILLKLMAEDAVGEETVFCGLDC